MTKYDYSKFASYFATFHGLATNAALQFTKRVGNKNQILEISFHQTHFSFECGDYKYSLPHDWLFMDSLTLAKHIAGLDETTILSYQKGF